MDEIPERKKALRNEIRARLRGMSESARRELSESATGTLDRQPIWNEARTILFYAPVDGEIDVWPMLLDALNHGKQAYLPRFLETVDANQRSSRHGTYVICRITHAEKDVRIGKFGIREPVESCTQGQLNWLDLTLVPGIAFDLHGCRLGRGKGYYDRLLADVSGTKCGVAFDEQIVESLPTEPHDVRLNCILTPTRWIELQPARGS